MGKGASRLELIAQQNELLKEQNDLLREQNELMKRSASNYTNNEREVFIENIDRDEMRSGFLVTSHRKKLWNVQIGLINEFARICKKHNLRWFAYGGTLLGAARHGGFIPWDDDVDLVMLRPDYEKFKSVVEDELKNHPHYHTWYWFNYRLETDKPSENTDLSLPLISKQQADMYPGWAPLHPLMRILDKRTTFIMHDTRKDVFYNAWIDILCVDPCPPLPDNSTEFKNFIVARELLAATVFPEQVKAAIEKSTRFIISRQELKNFLDLPYKQRARNFELFALKNFSRTEYVGEIRHHCITPKKLSYKTENFDEIVYLPFEKIELPTPAGYDNVLKDIYGDWHNLVITHTHSHEWSADVSFDEYKQKSYRFAQNS